jgi:hypothetical protein
MIWWLFMSPLSDSATHCRYQQVLLYRYRMQLFTEQRGLSHLRSNGLRRWIVSSVRYKVETLLLCAVLKRLIFAVMPGAKPANKEADAKQKTHMKLRRSLWWGLCAIYRDHEDAEALVCCRCQILSAPTTS